MKLSAEIRKKLIDLYEKRGISLEGNILKIIDCEDDAEFESYVNDAIKRDKDKQRQRLQITRRIQTQNNELLEAQEELMLTQNELKEALDSTEKAKEEALTDLDILQKKTQFELVQVIVKISLFIIIGVGLSTTVLYLYSIHTGRETDLIGNTWSNMFGILLTNAFSIIGTIMGVKYASGNKDSSNSK
jgi:hypothetical protein